MSALTRIGLLNMTETAPQFTKTEHLDGRVVLYGGDNRDVLKSLPDNSIDAIATDPPYALVSIQKRFGKPGSAPAKDVYGRGAAGFMGKSWDTGEVAFSEAFWAECLRVLKPGGHVVAFSGTRTYHRMAVAIEDAGFEIRDQLGWLYGSGFPKSHNQHDEWEGWGTALKPAWEPISLARKPLDGTVAANLAKWGVGALNIDGCRVGTDERIVATRNIALGSSGAGVFGAAATPGVYHQNDAGRWPANIVHDGSDEVLAAFPATAPAKAGKPRQGRAGDGYGMTHTGAEYNDNGGSAARFFKSCETDIEDWLWLNLNLSPAHIAESNSLLPSAPASIALAHAVSAALPEGLHCNPSSTEHSTSATPTELKRIAEAAIEAMQDIASRFLREWQQERLSPTRNPVSVVAQRTQTGTITITISHWKSDGSAAPVTFNITPKNLEAGARDYEQSTVARFMYCAKASRKDRDEGLEHLPKQVGGMVSNTSGQHITRRDEGYKPEPRANTHPTVKPTALMQWLCRLVTPPGGVILDPFMGSGSTGKAALLEGFKFIGIEKEDEYMPIAEARIAAALRPVAAEAQPAADNDNQRSLFDAA